MDTTKYAEECSAKLYELGWKHAYSQNPQSELFIKRIEIIKHFIDEAIQANRAEMQVSFAEPNQQLFTIAEVENYLERQKEICKQQYNLYCTDRGLPISDTCRKMILEAPTPNIVKS